MGVKNNLKKAIHRAILKAYQNGQSQRHGAVKNIVSDIKDPNSIAQVPTKELPAPSESVLHKDVTVSEIHQQKQANAMAKLGQPPKQPKFTNPPVVAPAGAGNPPGGDKKGKALKPLKMFIQKTEMKKANKKSAE